ncbi:haloacid dehalogenase-like hydrolase [Vibrio amylolyticus]|uniref:haloacid dehalogenase-like hydrolase n=1 Tax=Vibrio amylolyticus TaxID=2847292 RepID=UPI00354F4A80
MVNLESWHNAPFLDAIQVALEKWTDPSYIEYLPPSKRLAIFDLDGTLWCEKPLITEVAFWIHELDAVKQNNEYVQHHSDIDRLLVCVESGTKFVVAKAARLYYRIFEHQTAEQYQDKVNAWFNTALHPRFNVPLSELTYQPMKALLHHLQAHGFRCVINSGSTHDFLTACCLAVLNIDSQDVLGSFHSKKSEREPLDVNIGEKKVIQFKQKYDSIPVIAVGNTAHDIPLIEWVNGNKSAVTGFIHHDDCMQEYDYDFDSKLKAYLSLPSTQSYKISMKHHWKNVFEMDSAPMDRNFVSQV